MKKRKISIKDVAEAAGVSRAAVSLVLNDGNIRIGKEKRQRIIDVAKEMGYTPHVGARRLALRKMETLGLVFVDKPNALNEQYLFGLTHAVALEARRHGYDIHLRFLEALDGDRAPITPGLVDGSLIVAGKTTPPSFFEHFERVSHPHVVIGGGFMNPKPPDFVDVDVATGMMIATRHLVQLGHRRIAYVSASSNEDKLNGYIIGLTKARIPIQRPLILEGRKTDRDLDDTVESLLTMAERPTGVVCTSDWLAIRLMRSLREAGVAIPRDLSITGFDNADLADWVSPALTTVKVPGERIAQLAVRQVVRMIDGPVDTRLQSLLPAELVIRDSTMAPPETGGGQGGLSLTGRAAAQG
ncbi:MAG TPA: LacI family DNA-binding transcriptional regulator [Kiritimatiellia bacterium]|nr:LacI family DNA-binding transcriptional regulator [Kiritimatiellia bacterium]